jgi:hypothetical protein
MKRFAILFAAVTIIGGTVGRVARPAQPATAPTSQPVPDALKVAQAVMATLDKKSADPDALKAADGALDEAKDAQKALNAATASVTQAMADDDAQLQKDPAYQKLLAAVSAAADKRAAVRISDTATAQDKLDAASAFGNAQHAADQYRAAVLAKDQRLVAAVAARDQAAPEFAEAANKALVAVAVAAKKEVLTPDEYAKLPTRGSVVPSMVKPYASDPASFLDYGQQGLHVGCYGYMTNGFILHVINGSKAVVKIRNDQPNEYVIVEGLPTAGQADSSKVMPNCWFQIVGTEDWEGTTYFVAWQVVEGPPSAVAAKPAAPQH